jgi:hypothetical protein
MSKCHERIFKANFDQAIFCMRFEILAQILTKQILLGARSGCVCCTAAVAAAERDFPMHRVQSFDDFVSD